MDKGTETLVGDDIDIEDIVWYGSVDSVKDLAAQVGVDHTAPMKQLQVICNEATKQKRKIHFLPPYRHDTKIQIMDLLGIHPAQQKESASVELIMAIVRNTPSDTSLMMSRHLVRILTKWVASLMLRNSTATNIAMT